MMKRLSAVLAAPLLAAGLSAPAQAAQPVGVCGQGFTLVPISALQPLAPGFDFSVFDTNGDQLLCNRFVPAAAADNPNVPTGIAVDNVASVPVLKS